MLASLDAAGFRRVLTTYRDLLAAHEDELDRLNVYPVPDGDTGTNMRLTLDSVCTELDGVSDFAGVCAATAHGSLMGARGNSGVILSQLLRGLCEVVAQRSAIDAESLAAGLRRGSVEADAAVLRPVEGTILTVAREAAAAAEAVCRARGATLEEVARAARDAAHTAVARTPELLPALAEAGVVDAGGRGFALLLDAFLAVVADVPLPVPVAPGRTRVVAPAGAVHADATAGPRYEVTFLLAAPDAAVPDLRAAWGVVGDSVVVVGGDGTWSCHVHTDDIGAAIEAGIAVGRPSRIAVTDLFEQVAHRDGQTPPGARVVTAVVAVATGGGIEQLLRSAGAQAIVPGGQSMNPSTAEVFAAVERCHADGVVILPNNENIVPVAEAVRSIAPGAVSIVPTRSVVEGLVALVQYSPEASLEDNVAAMTDAVGNVRSGEVTRAVRDAHAECGPIAAGDWLAIAPEGICATAASAGDAAIALVDHLVGDESALVTVVLGDGSDDAATERLRAHLAARHPEIEVEVHTGDQPFYPYLLGVE